MVLLPEHPEADLTLPIAAVMAVRPCEIRLPWLPYTLSYVIMLVNPAHHTIPNYTLSYLIVPCTLCQPLPDWSLQACQHPLQESALVPALRTPVSSLALRLATLVAAALELNATQPASSLRQAELTTLVLLATSVVDANLLHLMASADGYVVIIIPDSLVSNCQHLSPVSSVRRLSPHLASIRLQPSRSYPSAHRHGGPAGHGRCHGDGGRHGALRLASKQTSAQAGGGAPAV